MPTVDFRARQCCSALFKGEAAWVAGIQREDIKATTLMLSWDRSHILDANHMVGMSMYVETSEVCRQTH